MLTKTKPYKHQATIIDESKDREYAGYFMEQGTGKTHVTIAVATHLFLQKKISAVLVLAPNGVHTNWAVNEIPTHCAVPYRLAVWNASDGKYKQAEFIDNLAEQPGMLTFILANTEAVRSVKFVELLEQHVLGQPIWTKLSRRNFMLAIDESTTIKNPSAAITKACIQLARCAAYRRILTGTPITQGPLDLFSQCQALSPDALQQKSMTAFKYEYAIEELCDLGPWRPAFKKVIGYRNQDKLARSLQPFTWRVTKTECLDLPSKIYQSRYVPITEEQRSVYRSLIKLAMAEVGGETVTTLSALTVLMRCQQVVQGYITTDNGEIKPIHSNRLSVFMDLVGEMPATDKVIVFCKYREDVRQIVEALGDASCVQYHGGIKEDERAQAVMSFQGNPTVRFFIATDAASRGLTLTAASQVVYYSQGYSLEKRLQSEDRAHRIGQAKSVIYTNLICKGTVDEKIIKALMSKKNIAEMVLNNETINEFLELSE